MDLSIIDLEVSHSHRVGLNVPEVTYMVGGGVRGTVRLVEGVVVGTEGETAVDGV